VFSVNSHGGAAWQRVVAVATQHAAADSRLDDVQ